MTLELSTLTNEYVRVPVSAIDVDGSLIDPTGDAIEMAFMSDGDPESGDWQTGDWETDTANNINRYFARCLTGFLDAGTYDLWVRIHDNPETVVRRVDTLIIE